MIQLPQSGLVQPPLCLTILEEAQAPYSGSDTGIVEGRPTCKVTLGSFEPSRKLMGGILAAAGIEGFLANRDAAAVEADRDTERWKPFVETWWITHEPNPMRRGEAA